MNAVTPAGRLDRETAEALEAGRPLEAFAVLGPHETKAGRMVRVFAPGAHAVEVVGRDDGRSWGTLTPGLASAAMFRSIYSTVRTRRGLGLGMRIALIAERHRAEIEFPLPARLLLRVLARVARLTGMLAD